MCSLYQLFYLPLITVSHFSLILILQLFDGHNGSAAAIYTKENLLSNVLAAIPSDLNRDEWVAALPRALVAGFVKTDKDFQEKGMSCFNVIYYRHGILIWSCHGREGQSCSLWRKKLCAVNHAKLVMFSSRVAHTTCVQFVFSYLCI